MNESLNQENANVLIVILTPKTKKALDNSINMMGLGFPSAFLLSIMHLSMFILLPFFQYSTRPTLFTLKTLDIREKNNI